MGKRRNQRKQYVSAAEHAAGVNASKGFKTPNYQKIRRLPFDRCALSMTPYETPVCAEDGTVFDLVNIVPYIAKHKKNPITGAPLSTKSLIRLNMKKNANDRWCCPITYNEFTKNSHIVAIRPTGNVYSWEAVEEMNLKPRTMEDLITGDKFTMDDIITIQDPKDVFIRDMNVYPAEREAKLAQGSKTQRGSVQLNSTMQRILSQVPGASTDPGEKEQSPPQSSSAPKDGPRGLHTPAAYAASFTSTALAPVTSKQRELLSEAEIREQRYRHMRKDPNTKKSYVRLRTTMGDLNLQLETDLVPKTCHNFLLLCERGYYDGVIFHRLVPGFMEFHDLLKHDGRGILSMANAGKNTNNSQFFITFTECPHLDRKHSVFGRVVGGRKVLDVMEQIPCKRSGPGKEKVLPKEEIRITGVEIIYNAFDEPWEAKDELELLREKDRAKERNRLLGMGHEVHEDEDEKQDEADEPLFKPPKSSSGGIGKYLPAAPETPKSKKKKKKKKSKSLSFDDDTDDMPPPPIPRARVSKPTTTFGNFDGW